MSKLKERLEVLTSCREDWVNAFAEGEDGPFMIQDLANIQLCIMASEAEIASRAETPAACLAAEADKPWRPRNPSAA